jgi:hypothetical protein
MESTLPSSRSATLSLKRFVWGNIFAPFALIVAFYGQVLFLLDGINQAAPMGNLLAEVIIYAGSIIVAQSYCLALVRLRSARIRRVLAEVIAFQFVALFAMTIFIIMLTAIWPDLFSLNLAFIFDQGYSWVFYVIGALPVITFVYLFMAVISSAVVAGCTMLVANWRDMRVEPISIQRLLLVFGAMFGSASVLGMLWLVWMPGIVNQTSGDPIFVILLVLLLLFLPAIMLVAIGAVASWRSIAQQ